jgi:hypothetical protein
VLLNSNTTPMLLRLVAEDRLDVDEFVRRTVLVRVSIGTISVDRISSAGNF